MNIFEFMSGSPFLSFFLVSIIASATVKLFVYTIRAITGSYPPPSNNKDEE